MINKERIELIVNQIIDAEKEFVVDITVSASNHILVLIDSEAGVVIKRCVEISRFIESQLDREEEDFELEVSSAGLTSPLKVHRQYAKNIGRAVEVLLNDGQKVTGKIIEVSPLAFTIQYQEKISIEGSKKKQLVDQTKEIPFAEVKTTVIIISFR
jgi:ribosome maturation factor RimP